jgi:3-deoxy-D-manno-octulosonate 8-phosphate phosphatase (KDO 8-P phosphatase)
MIRALFLDVDGVLSDGKIIYNIKGEETKRFDVHDGFGIKLAQHTGIEIIIISGRKSEVTDIRAVELGIEKVHTGIGDKASLYKEIRDSLSLADDECAGIGDDLNDLGLLRIVGLSATVADAPDYMKEAVDFVSTKNGGSGAVREFIELILKKNGKWEEILKLF